MHQPLSCLPKRMSMATTWIGECVETTLLSINKLSPINMPCIHLRRSFDVVGHARVFSTLDLRAGYHKLPIREKDKAKTTFWGVNSHGKDCLYQWKFLPFGLKNAPAKFQRVMDKILAGLDFVRCYIDDIVVYSDTVEEHQIHLKIVFEWLKVHGLRLHPGKCKFFQESVEYLGYVIYPGGWGVQ